MSDLGEWALDSVCDALGSRTATAIRIELAASIFAGLQHYEISVACAGSDVGAWIIAG